MFVCWDLPEAVAQGKFKVKDINVGLWWMPAAQARQSESERERKSFLETESARGVYDPVQRAGVLHHHQHTLTCHVTLSSYSSSSSLLPHHPHIFPLLSDVNLQSTGPLPSSDFSPSHGETLMSDHRCLSAALEHSASQLLSFPFLSLTHSSHLWCHHSLYLHFFLTSVLIELCSVSPAGLFRVPFHKRGNVWAVCVMYVRHSLMSKSPYGVPHSSALWTPQAVIEWTEWWKKPTGRDGDQIGRWMQTTAFTLYHELLILCPKIP